MILCEDFKNAYETFSERFNNSCIQMGNLLGSILASQRWLPYLYETPVGRFIVRHLGLGKTASDLPQQCASHCVPVDLTEETRENGWESLARADFHACCDEDDDCPHCGARLRCIVNEKTCLASHQYCRLCKKRFNFALEDL